MTDPLDDATNTHFDSTAWKSPQALAETRVEIWLGTGANLPIEVVAEAVVEITFEVLAEPDREMVSAGIDRMEQLMSRRRAVDQRDLVTEIFQAMLRQARAP